MQPKITAFFDEPTHTVSYVVVDPDTKACVVIDSVLDFDQAAYSTSHDSADGLVQFVKQNELTVHWILETHVHADHLSAAPYIKKQLGGQIAISHQVTEVQKVFGDLYNFSDEFVRDGSQFDQLIEDGQTLTFGSQQLTALSTPGHTPACMTFVIGNSAFVGDTLFMPDFGTARTDFPGGDAKTLYRSIQRILSLPPATRLFMCHDYKAPGRDEYAWETTVQQSRDQNIHLLDNISEVEFVSFREERDATLPVPKLMLPSVQVNIRGGELPDAAENGIRYLKMPLNALI